MPFTLLALTLRFHVFSVNHPRGNELLLKSFLQDNQVCKRLIRTSASSTLEKLTSQNGLRVTEIVIHGYEKSLCFLFTFSLLENKKEKQLALLT